MVRTFTHAHTLHSHTHTHIHTHTHTLQVNEKLFVASAGDSRAVLCRDGAALALSEDHHPDSPKEKERVVAAGGKFYKSVSGGALRGLWVLSLSLSLSLSCVCVRVRARACWGVGLVLLCFHAIG